ncbi:MAG: gamma-glutamyltransferase, partial [Sphingomonadales bacterium]
MKNTSLIALFCAVLMVVPTTARSEAVATSADPRATAAGAEILAKGGSAADAAMAMMLALTVVEPQSSGIGGGGFLVHFDAKDGELSTINGRETAPATARPDRFMGLDGKPMPFVQAWQGGHSAGVPGNIRLLADAHRNWGRLKWAELFKPAIRLAGKGFVVNKTLESRLEGVARFWPNFDAARSIYWIDGKPAKAGDVIRNPALATTLKTIARKGPDAFYKGAIANQIVDAVTTSKVSPGDMTLADLAAYKAVEQNAVCAPYRVYVICG